MATRDKLKIAARIAERKRRWVKKRLRRRCFRGRISDNESSSSNSYINSRSIDLSTRHRSPSRRHLQANTDSRVSPSDIAIIKEKLGNYRHHGTGNLLARRAPGMPEGVAVRKLAAIIRTGALGESASDSTPKLKTEVGGAGSFWTHRLRHAGGYGWTGLILSVDVDSSRPLPVEQVCWFLVEDDKELEMLRSILLMEAGVWESVRDRCIAVAQLAQFVNNTT
uniref:Uncharacterized protein n=1 Tax=Odontella aurita TaxID=265563 RepID=A0A7S4MTW0_9STRA